ncbi:MAG: alpha/beta hydrolase [Rhodococcus sp. (in: high G+C Gram-positive bacteria)]|uniref:alpha/beta fold hydrolase n=1 Tax=Rhodococcus sp. TaxID=1831 RepID=UPI00120F1921|nr:alpha/beta hydrolase [Rhodococcus sp. (in: high G+C Gram-positive bacteria)]RZL24928.1 MAG: alpha/beta hydrolase [Rhodococcus sp. (in: high G+C Gram-positive bacteria)]
MSYIKVEEGVQLFVQDLGSGTPVVLIAGFGLNHEVWDRQVRTLTASHRVICVDQRGHGLSDKPLSGYSIDQLARDLLTVLDEVEIDTCTVVGWSFGGQVAFRAAALDGGRRISRIALIGSNAVRASRGPSFPFGRPPEELEPALVEAERSGRIASRRNTIVSGLHRDIGGDSIDWLVRCSLQMPSWAAVACYNSMLNADLTDDIDQVTIPVLQVVGASDPVHSAKGARWLNQRLANARLQEIEDCGHYPMLEAADQFDQLLLEFIEE